MRLLFMSPLFLIMWVIYFLVWLPLWALGWILVPIAAAFKAYEPEYVGFNRQGIETVIWHFTWPFMFVWGNYEDGIANDTYIKFDSMFMRIVYWCCIRNPTNNLRILPYISVRIDPKKVRYIGNLTDISKYDTPIPQWFFAWQGLYSNLFWQFNMFGSLWRIWIGWKIYPTDIYGVTEYRKNGAGFATQFKRVKT